MADGAPMTLERLAVPDDRAAAFGELVDRQRDRALRIAWRLVGGSDTAAEDVVQEAFVRAWRGLAGFRGEATLETWFTRIVIREAHRHRRWRRLRRLWTSSLEHEPEAEQPHGADPWLRRRIAAALDGLSRGQREAFVLVHLEQVPVSECALILGKAEGTVKSQLQRALARLRVELAEVREREVAS